MADSTSLFQRGELLQSDPFDPRPIGGTVQLRRGGSAVSRKLAEEPAEDLVYQRAFGGCADCPRDLLFRTFRRLDIEDTIEQVAEWAGCPTLDARWRMAVRVET